MMEKISHGESLNKNYTLNHLLEIKSRVVLNFQSYTFFSRKLYLNFSLHNLSPVISYFNAIVFIYSTFSI
jgi:hypothetical protein